MSPRTLMVIVPMAMTLLSCVPANRSALGVQCEKNSECDTPLVCRLGACRRECRTSQDCIAPSICLLDERELGACRLESEGTCALQSDCPMALICRPTGCVNECAGDRDCLAGAACEDGACLEPATRSCAGDGDCLGTEACIAGRCRPQCREDRDCRNAYVCQRTGAFGRCVRGPTDDAGLDGAMDAVMPPTCGMAGASPLSGATVLAAGDNFNCAVADVGGSPQVVCWGEGMTTCPVPVSGIDGSQVQALAAGGIHVCALLVTGDVLCWGDNSNGTLGLGMAVTATPTPTMVAGIGRATSIVAGSAHVCVTREGLNALCWGLAGQDRLGTGVTVGTEYTPVESTNVPLPDYAGAGLDFSCMATSGAAPTCFGNDANGQLGVALGAMMTGVQVDGGAQHACGIDTLGNVFCWGQTADGQLGNPTNDGTSRQSVTLPMRAKRIALGDRHSCAVLNDDSLYCWGRNGDGQVEPGGPATHPTPFLVALPGGETTSVVSAGSRHTCALTTLGGIYCWGDNSRGQLGNNSTTPATTIQAVLAP